MNKDKYRINRLNLLKPLSDSKYNNPIMGDVEEGFNEILKDNGRIQAYFWLLVQISTSIPVLFYNSISRSKMMFINYLKVALRNIARNKTHTFINIFGLSIGIACSILIFLFVRNELSYDKFHENSERLFRVWTKEYNPEREVLMSSETPVILSEVLKSDYPEIETTIRYFTNNGIVKLDNNTYIENLQFSDPGFFEMFTFSIVSGSTENLLSDINSIVITESISQKYFPDQDPIGRSLVIDLSGYENQYNIAAVIQDIPDNSSITLDIIISFEKLREVLPENVFRSWGNILAENYVLLKPETIPAELEKKFDSISADHYQKQMGKNWRSEYLLQPFGEIHLDKSIPSGILPVSDPAYAIMLSGIGILVLFIACINFMTLSLGKSTGRAREVGMRKVMGAFRGQLIKQYLGEAVLTSFFALMIGIVFAVLVLPYFNGFTGKNLVMAFEPGLIIMMLTVVLIIGIAAGSYPAFNLSGFQPVSVIRKNLKLTGKGVLGKVLIIMQFAISIILIISTLIMNGQMTLLKEKNLGFDKERTIIIETNANRENDKQLYNTFKNELSGFPEIKSLAASSNTFGIRWSRFGFSEQSGTFRSFYANIVDYDYIKTLGIKLKSGREFSREFTVDETQSIVVNEELMKYFGWDTIEDKKLPGPRLKPHRIIGVVEDFHFNSLHEEIRPMALMLNTREPFTSGLNDVSTSTDFLFGFILVRIDKGPLTNVIDKIEDKWKNVSGGQSLEFSFLDENLNEQYKEEKKWSNGINYASVFAVLIACLGLLGLAALAAEKRIKEIGIRKVLGASAPKIILLLSKELLILVSTANILAWPAAYFSMNTWLNNFAYKFEPGLFLFILSGLLALSIAVITICIQTLKTAYSNPADTLRYE